MLRWAYYDVAVSAQTIKQSSVAQFMGDDNRENPEADPLRPRSIDLDAKPRGTDASGQAGSIQRVVESFGETELAHLWTRFLVRKHRTLGRQYVTAKVVQVVNETEVLEGLVRELVAYEYGRKRRLEDLQKKYNVGRRRRREIHRQVHDFISALAYRAETQAYERLQRMGVIL